MRECRHPNIVLFLGLAHEPVTAGRTFVSHGHKPDSSLVVLVRAQADLNFGRDRVDLFGIHPVRKPEVVHPGEQSSVPMEVENQLCHRYRPCRRLPSR